MSTYRTETTVAEDGSVLIHDLPLPPGAKVEILVLCRPEPSSEGRDPLRGTPLTYDQPTEPVAEEDGEALR